MRAKIGDEILIRGAEPWQADRVATVLDVATRDGVARYDVHWLADDYDATIVAGPRISIDVIHRAGVHAAGILGAGRHAAGTHEARVPRAGAHEAGRPVPVPGRGKALRRGA
jgi:hypothetical protein